MLIMHITLSTTQKLPARTQEPKQTSTPYGIEFFHHNERCTVVVRIKCCRHVFGRVFSHIVIYKVIGRNAEYLAYYGKIESVGKSRTLFPTGYSLARHTDFSAASSCDSKACFLNFKNFSAKVIIYSLMYGSILHYTEKLCKLTRFTNAQQEFTLNAERQITAF